MCIHHLFVSVCVCVCVYSILCVCAACVCVLPDRGVQLVAGVLLVVQLGEQGEEHLHPSDGVYPALDGVGHHRLDILEDNINTYK